MSDKIKTLLVRDSRLPAGKKDGATIMVPTGPESVFWETIQPADPTSLNPQYQINLASQLTGLSRTVWWEFSGSLTVTGTALNLLQVNNRVALRQFAMTSCCNAMNISFGSSNVSLGGLNQYISGLLRVGNGSESGVGIQSACASMPDTVSDYEDCVGRRDSPFAPVGDYPVSSYDSPPRTVGITGITVNGPATSMVVSFTVREPLVISPMGYTDDSKEKALYGLNKVTVTMTMGAFHRALSLAIPAGSTVSAVTLAPTSSSLICTFITPDADSMAVAMTEARTFRYDYTDLQPQFSTLTGGVVAPGATVTASGNAFRLGVIPTKFIIYATYSETDRLDPTQSLPDVCLPITSITIQAGTKSGLLSGAPITSLWELSYKNGGRTPFYIYDGREQVSSATTAGTGANGAGAPLVLDTAADLGLPAQTVPGQSISYQFAVTSVTVRNNMKIALTAPRLIVIPVVSGILENTAGQTVIINGGVPDRDAIDFKMASSIMSSEYHSASNSAGYGGGRFGDFFKKAFNDVGKVLKTGAEAAKEASSQVMQRALPMATQLALESLPPQYRIPAQIAASSAGLGGLRERKKKGGAAVSRDMLYM